MPRAQQRTSALRRVPTNFFGVQYQSRDWSVDHFAGNDVWVAVYQAGAFIIDTALNLTIGGIPAFVISNAFGNCTAVVIDGGLLKLTFDAAPSEPFQILLPANDPAVRDNYASYLTGKFVDIPVPVIPPSNQLALSVAAGGLGAQVTLEEVQGLNYMNGLPVITNITTAEVATKAVMNSPILDLEFPTPPISGDNIIWGFEVDRFLNPTGGTLDAWSLFIP